MKVGIFTFHNAINYGAVLQAYGLQKAIEQLGHSVEIVNFRYFSNQFNLLRSLKKNLKHIVEKSRIRKFELFRNDWLHIGPEIKAFDELLVMSDEVGAFIVGSDQIWNANFWSEPQLAYFLTFCMNSNVRKISYAACFGQKNQPAEYLNQLGELLKNIEYLSVRGTFNAEIINEHTTRMAEVVVDPTLLCSFDDILAESNNNKGCILLYSLSRQMAREFHDMADILKKETGKSVVSISPKFIYPFADYYVTDTGPSEFVSMIRDAGYILTDSYHGTVLSLKYRKPFVACNRSGREIRIIDVLHQFGVNERYVTSVKDALEKKLLNTEVDYTRIIQRMDHDIEQSVSFLRRSLS